MEVAAVVVAWVVAVVVRWVRGGVDGLGDCQVQLLAVCVAVRDGSLAEVVVEVPDELVGDQQTQQMPVAFPG